MRYRYKFSRRDVALLRDDQVQDLFESLPPHSEYHNVIERVNCIAMENEIDTKENIQLHISE